MKTKTVKLMIKYGQLILIDNQIIQGNVDNVKLIQNILYGSFRGIRVSKPTDKAIWLECAEWTDVRSYDENKNGLTVAMLVDIEDWLKGVDIFDEPVM